MTNPLAVFGNIPVHTSAVASLFPGLKAGNQKVRSLESNGSLLRLKKGLYVVSPEVSGKALSTELIANHLCAPSYVSMSTALRYYGLIPEAVYLTQSMTLKRARRFETAVGCFDYYPEAPAVFSTGVRSILADGYAFLMATPEKALCDLVANSPGLQLRSRRDVELYIEQDLRIDLDDFLRFDPDVLRRYVEVGKKASSVATLLRYLEK